ncbi:MAG TPA: hypothetical protein VF219_16480 [Vicinamibacterales bacterium]
MDDSVTDPRSTGTDVSIVKPRLKLTQNRATRRTRADLPWLSTIKLPWGLEVRLLNMSTSGVLVETTSKFTPGSVADFEIAGSDDSLVVPARFVRSEIVGVDARGVRYRAAAVFEREVDLDGPRARIARVASTPNGLANWLQELSGDIERKAGPDALRARFESGLCRLVSAREVRILDEPAPPVEGCESIFFNMSAGGTRRVMQVTFEPGYEPSELDFKLLQAGASLAAVIWRLS